MPDYKIIEGHKRTSEDIAYTEMLVKEKATTQRKPGTTTQCASTQRLLTMTAEELSAYRNRPNPTNWLANPDATNMDEAVGERIFTVEEVRLQEYIRHKNRNSLGQYDMSGAEKELKDKAIDAFNLTPPAPLDKVQIERITKIKQIVELKELKYEWKPLTTWQAFKHWIKGGKVEVGLPENEKDKK